MKTSTDERFRQITDDVKPTLTTRALRWLWYRNTDPEALIGWLILLLLIACFWGLVGWAIWSAIR